MKAVLEAQVDWIGIVIGFRVSRTQHHSAFEVIWPVAMVPQIQRIMQAEWHDD